jgi:hypothetical protein
MKCNCPAQSPFKWHETHQASIVAKDISFRASANGLSISQAASGTSLEKVLAKKGSFIHGISRNKEAEILRLKTFLTYSKAHAEV